MVVWFLQANLNHARQAQQLFPQALAERGAGLEIVAEPWKVSEENQNWLGDEHGLAAIVRVNADLSPLSYRLGGGRITSRLSESPIA